MVLAPQPSGSHAAPAHHLGGGTLAGSRCSCARVTGAFELSWVHEVADNAAIVFATSPSPDGTTSSGCWIGRTMAVVTTVSTSLSCDLHLPWLNLWLAVVVVPSPKSLRRKFQILTLCCPDLRSKVPFLFYVLFHEGCTREDKTPNQKFLCLRRASCKKRVTLVQAWNDGILIIGISSSNPAAATSEIEVSCLAAITTVAGSCQLESLCSRWKYSSDSLEPRDQHFPAIWAA